MNSTLCVTTDVELDNYVIQTDTMPVEDTYTTIPIVAIQPLYQEPDEEELHTSFEEAISERLVTLRKRLSQTSNALLSTQQLRRDIHPVSLTTGKYATTPLSVVPSSVTRPSLLGNESQRVVIFACLALMCMLIGFDLMGLLVLSIR
jgi:hypothetical protein